MERTRGVLSYLDASAKDFSKNTEKERKMKTMREKLINMELYPKSNIYPMK